MVSMKDLAAACNVSIATVSKALNDQRDVSAKTKEMVKKTAKELGYFSGSSVKAHKAGRSYNVGVLFAEDARIGLTDDYLAGVLDSFKRTTEHRDYDMTLVNCSKGRRDGMTYLERVRYRELDAVAMICIDFRDPQVLELVDSDIPVVTIDYIFNNRIAVISDNVRGMQDLVTYVHEMGHRKIAYIHGNDNSVTQARVSSFYSTCARLGIDVPDAYILEADYRNEKDSYNRTMELLDLADPPTCILYPDDLAAFGGIRAIRERGLEIPEDISVAGYDGIRIGRYIEPKLTTIRQDTEQIGKMAAENMIRLIEHPRSTIIRPILAEGELFRGGTVSKIKESDGPQSEL